MGYLQFLITVKYLFYRVGRPCRVYKSQACLTVTFHFFILKNTFLKGTVYLYAAFFKGLQKIELHKKYK